jgi:DNA-binding MarR family transcriptional regulator
VGRPHRKVQITDYDGYTLSPKEKLVYHEILKETILKNKRCVELSLSELGIRTGIARTTVREQLNRLQKRRLITIDSARKTNTICLVTTYKEILRI